MSIELAAFLLGVNVECSMWDVVCGVGMAILNIVCCGNFDVSDVCGCVRMSFDAQYMETSCCKEFLQPTMLLLLPPLLLKM